MIQTKDSSKPASARFAGGVLMVAAMLAVTAAIGLAAVSIIHDPSIVGITGGVFSGLLLGLVIMGAGAWVGMSLARGPKEPDTAGGEAIEAELKDVLDEVETARLDTLEKVNRRAMWSVPLCTAGGIVLLILAQFTDDPPDFTESIALALVPGVLGYLWASFDLSSSYTRLYKNKVLSRLAATFGELSYRSAVMPDLARLKEENIFRKFDASEADDEIFGTHRNLPINIVELKLTFGSGNSEKTMFDGLLVTLDLPRDTGAVTAVISDAGAFGNFLDRQKTQRRERVRLEDPRFEAVYEVYSSDQVESRALLHPAFMEKLLVLGQLPGFGRPLVLCAGRVLQIAMPRESGGNLFEAPNFRKPAATRETLVQLRKDIAAVLAAADAVIDLDRQYEMMSRS